MEHPVYFRILFRKWSINIRIMLHIRKKLSYIKVPISNISYRWAILYIPLSIKLFSEMMHANYGACLINEVQENNIYCIRLN